MAHNGKKNRIISMLPLALLVAVILASIGYSSIKLRAEYKEKLKEKEKLEAQIAEAESYTEELYRKRAYVQTKKFIEDIAREYLGLVYPDDILIVPEDK